MKRKHGSSEHPLDGIGQQTGWRFWLLGIVLLAVLFGLYLLASHIDRKPCDAHLSVRSAVTEKAVKEWAATNGITLTPLAADQPAATTYATTDASEKNRRYAISREQEGIRSCSETLRTRVATLAGAQLQKRH